MAEAAQWAYFDGQVRLASEVCLPIDDWGVRYGLGFFETFRTSGGRPHHWSYHARRLHAACARAKIMLPATFLARDEARLREVVRGLLQASGMPDAVFRYTITAGKGGDVFNRPSELLTLRSLPASPEELGVGLRVLALRRDNGEWLPRPKSLNYANAMLGARELEQRGAAPSGEGLFLSREDGWVVETARQNVAWFEGTALCYPDPDVGAVAGTCLAWALEKFPAARRVRAKLESVVQADAIIVLNAVRGVTPVREFRDVEDRVLRILESARHPMVMKFRREWDDALAVSARS